MSDKVLFYKQIVPLNEQRYKQFCIKNSGDYSFARGTNAVFLSQMEFSKAAREYPIVFAGKEDSLAPLVLVGLENQQNLFIDRYNQWNAEYIPAYVRRYPFILAKNESEQYTVCIDESYEGFNQDGEGESLFNESGERSNYLNKRMEFLNQYQMDHKRTRNFTSKLQEFDLLEPMQANVELNTGVRVSLKDFFVVSRKRLKELEPEKLVQLLQSDALERIFIHLNSLETFNSLMERFAAYDKAS